MVFLIIIGAFLGRFLIGAILHAIFKPDEVNPNSEFWFGTAGAILGVIISMLIYRII